MDVPSTYKFRILKANHTFKERKGKMEIERIQRKERRSVSGQSDEKEKTLTTTTTTPSSPANNNN